MTDRLWTRYFITLTGSHLISAFAWSSMILLPVYLEFLHADRAQIGLIVGIASLGGLLLRPLVGWLLDALGRRPILIGGTILVSFSMGLLLFVRDIGPLIFVQRILFGIGMGALFTGYFAFADDHIPKSRRTEGIAIFGIAGLLPLSLNAFVDRMGIAAADLRWFFPVLGMVVLTSVLCLWSVPEVRQRTSTERSGIRPVWRALSGRPLQPVWIATIVFSGLVSVFAAFITIAGERRGIDRPAMLWLYYAIAATAVRLVGGRLPDRIGTSNLIAPSLGCYAAAVLIAAASWSQFGFIVSGVLAGIGHGYCFPVLTSQVFARSPGHLRGSAMAAFTAIFEVAVIVLTPIFGLIADRFDDATMFSLLAVVTAIGLAWWARVEHVVVCGMAKDGTA